MGSSVTLTGSGFTNASSVRLNGTLASSFTATSDSQLAAIVPSGATSGPLTVTTAGGTATSSGSFTVSAPPPPTTTTTTAYYGTLAESVNGALSCTLSDGLGSVSTSVNTSGQVTARQLYGPYGVVRYSSGTLPTDYGFTGQRADATIGLNRSANNARILRQGQVAAPPDTPGHHFSVSLYAA